MDAITNCESKLPQAHKDLLETKKLERRSIRGQITKAVNKLTKDIDSGKKHAISFSRTILSEALKELDKKDNEVWAFYDDDAMAADMEQGESWTEKGLAAITNADDFLDSLNPVNTHPASTTTPAAPATSNHARTPKIEIPKFYGKSPA